MNQPNAALTPEDQWLTRKGAAHYLQTKGCETSRVTLERMAANNNQGGGPPFYVYRNKKRNHVRYLIKDLDAWAAKKVRRVE
jgi:hypothetical protein